MKKLILTGAILLLIALSAFAGRYDIILKDGTRINVDSYRKAGGLVYYPGLYGVEAFVSEDQVKKIVDLEEQAKNQALANEEEAKRRAFKAAIDAMDEASIKKLFDLIVVEFVRICKDNKSHFNTDNFTYEIVKTASPYFPYRAKLFIVNETHWDHYHTLEFDALLKRWEHIEGIQSFPKNNVPKVSMKTCIAEWDKYHHEFVNDNPCYIYNYLIESLSIQDSLLR
jgi:hypothetical protein